MYEAALWKAVLIRGTTPPYRPAIRYLSASLQCQCQSRF